MVYGVFKTDNICSIIQKLSSRHNTQTCRQSSQPQRLADSQLVSQPVIALCVVESVYIRYCVCLRDCVCVLETVCVPCYSTSACTCINYIKSKSVHLCDIGLSVYVSVCVVDLRVWVSVCECLYILLFMNMALPDTLQQKATNFLYTTVHYEHMSISLSLSLSLHISFSVRPFVCPVSVFFYMNMVACKSKEFRFCLPAFTTLSLSQPLSLLLVMLLARLVA